MRPSGRRCSACTGAAVSCGAIHRIRVGGALKTTVTYSHLRVLPGHQRKGLWGAANQALDKYRSRADGTSAGHAYWLYGVELRDGSGTAPLGTIDVRSEGFGVGDPHASATQLGAGALTGGQLGAIPFTSESKTWEAAPSAPARDVLDITARNISQAK